MARIEPDVRTVEEIKAAGGDTVKKCYQCATCATVCPLSQDDMPFPRRQMLMGQWGLKDRLLSDPSLWLCHQCGDCTVYCPRGARPGDVLGALRNMAVRELAEFKFLWTFYNRPWGLPLLLLIAFAFIFGAFSVFWAPEWGIHFPYVPHIDLLSSIPQNVEMVDAVFLPLAAFVAVMSAIGINRLWNGMCSQVNIPAAYQKNLWGVLSTYLVPAIKEILAHVRFQECGANQWRFNGHRMLLWSFIILFIVTNIVFVAADILHFHTPWPLYHPVKILANIGAILLLYGVLSILVNRGQAEGQGKVAGSYQDWFLIYLILAVGLTGVLTEVLRLAGGGGLYLGFYIAHLVAVFLLFLSIPYSKFAHLIYRTTAVVFDLYVKDVRARMAEDEARVKAERAALEASQEEVSEEASGEAEGEEGAEASSEEAAKA